MLHKAVALPEYPHSPPHLADISLHPLGNALLFLRLSGSAIWPSCPMYRASLSSLQPLGSSHTGFIPNSAQSLFMIAENPPVVCVAVNGLIPAIPLPHMNRLAPLSDGYFHACVLLGMLHSAVWPWCPCCPVYEHRPFQRLWICGQPLGKYPPLCRCGGYAMWWSWPMYRAFLSFL